MDFRQDRRSAFKLLAAGAVATMGMTSLSSRAWAYPAGQPALEFVAQSPDFTWNAVTLTRSNRMFAAMPRWPGFEKTPAVVEILSDGTLKPYPGKGYNDWRPGADALNAFVCINTVHCFDGRHLWVLDTGTVPLATDPRQAGAQKLVQIDTETDTVVKTYRFDTLLPVGSSLNDLRMTKEKIYLTESDVGSIVVIDRRSGAMLRRLRDDPSTKALPSRPKIGPGGKWMTLPDGKPQMTNADPIELSPDHRWLYYSPASGPLFRVETRYLNDATLSEADLGKRVEYVYDMPTVGGTAMDDHGNMFFAESARPRISALAPDGTLRIVVEDDRLWGADALFITPDRHLYIPMSQVPNVIFSQGINGKDVTTRPFKIFRMKLSSFYGGPVSE